MADQPPNVPESRRRDRVPFQGSIYPSGSALITNSPVTRTWWP